MTTQSPATLIKELASREKLPACIVITSQDPIRRERALKFLLDRFVLPPYKATVYNFAEQSRQTITDFIFKLKEPSLFEPIRYGLIKNIQDGKVVDLEPLSKHMTAEQPNTVIIIVDSSLPNSPNFKKIVEKHTVHLNFPPLKGAELWRWTEKELRQSGIQTINETLLEKIISNCEESPDLIAKLIEKLSIYLDGEAPSLESLYTLCPANSHVSDFELSDSLLTKKRINSELLIHQLFDQGSSPYMLIGLLCKNWITLLRIRSMLDRGAQTNEIREATGISPWLLNKYLPVAKKLSRNDIMNATTALLSADFRIKDRSLGHQMVFSDLASSVAVS